jgi:hypothetical protein
MFFVLSIPFVEKWFKRIKIFFLDISCVYIKMRYADVL